MAVSFTVNFAPITAYDCTISCNRYHGEDSWYALASAQLPNRVNTCGIMHVFHDLRKWWSMESSSLPDQLGIVVRD
jgi:hypothetical protein